MSAVSECPYRDDVHGEGDAEEARCRLVEQVSDFTDEPPCRVGRAVCEACCKWPEPSPESLNPVVASLLFTRALDVQNRDGVGREDVDKAARLRRRAEQNLLHMDVEAPIRRNEGPCFHLGVQTGLRDCPTCHGSVRAKVFACHHVLHDQTTLKECASCPDFDPRLRRGAVTTWAVGVTTAPRAEPTLERCLRSLAAAGWDAPRLFAEPRAEVPAEFSHLPTTRRDETLGEWPNWFLGLSELVHRAPEADAYMMVQDDVVFCRNTRAFLEAVLWPDPRVGIVSVYCSEPYARADQGWALVDTRQGMVGALTCVFPSAAARALLADPRIVNQRQRGALDGLVDTDGVLGRWAGRAGMSVYFHSPSLAQHIGDTSTVWQGAENAGHRHSNNFLGEDFDALDLVSADNGKSAPAVVAAGAPPLVSCIMPTGDRRAFVKLAVRHFLDQDYPNKELIVVDDGADPVGDLVEGLPHVRYVRLANRLSLGEKRNLACREARGEIIAHWDDDDWHSPRRLSYQVAPIAARDFEVTGLRRTFVLELPEAVWRMFEGELHLGTLVYRRSLLDEGLSYPDLNVGEDVELLGQAVAWGNRLARLDDPDLYVYVRHGRNAWNAETGGWIRVDPPASFPGEALTAIREAASDLGRLSPSAGNGTAADASRFVDCLCRAEIKLPDVPLRAERCIATVVSPGFTAPLDDLLSSLQAKGGCQDALVVVFAVNPDAECRRIAAMHGAALIPCVSRSVVNSTIKSVLYSAARVVDAEKFICLDADMLILDDLGPIFAALDASPDRMIFAARDGAGPMHPDLGAAIVGLYGARTEDFARLLGESNGEGAYPLVVNDGLFGACRSALLTLDETIRKWKNASAWVDERPDIPYRNQFVFNLALAHLDCGAELDPTYNIQLEIENVDWDIDQGRPTAHWRGRPAHVLHFNGPRGRIKHPEWRAFAAHPTEAPRNIRARAGAALPRVLTDESMPDGLLAPTRSPEGTARADKPWEGAIRKKPWEYRVAAAIVHVDRPDLLAEVIETLRAQTERPYLIIIDAGSLSEHRPALGTIESSGQDLEIHYLRPKAWRLASEPVAVAMQLALERCQTEFLYSTHTDVFLKRRDYLAWLVSRCDARTPAVGYQMSPRNWATDLWQTTLSHTATLYHVPTCYDIGLTWNMHRAMRHLKMNPEDVNNGWPDTEVMPSLCYHAAGIGVRWLDDPEPSEGDAPSVLMIGTEPNEPYEDENLEHVRSTTLNGLYAPAMAQGRASLLASAVVRSRARVTAWKRPSRAT